MLGVGDVGDAFSMCTVESDSKKESVFMFTSALGLRRRLGDKLVRTETGGFVGVG
jgi:hypothetical protein